MRPHWSIPAILVVQLLAGSLLGPRILCLCADTCAPLDAGRAGCVEDECCPTADAVGPFVRVVTTGEPCGTGCLDIAWPDDPKLLLKEAEVASLPAVPVPQAVGTAVAPDRRCRVDRTAMATGPPGWIGHLRTVVLVI